MMYLSKIVLNSSFAARKWSSNPYRVHQRLSMACELDPRVLFRMESTNEDTTILVQSQNKPDWESAFANLQVLTQPVECKEFKLGLENSRRLRFKLAANPTVKRNGKRQGLLKEEDQIHWLTRKLGAAGACLQGCRILSTGFQRSTKSGEGEDLIHWIIVFEGLLEVTDAQKFEAAVKEGVGAAKGFGCGLLSLARAD